MVGQSYTIRSLPSAICMQILLSGRGIRVVRKDEPD